MLKKITIAILPILLSGCISLDPDYERPDAPIDTSSIQGGVYSHVAQNNAIDYRHVSWQEYIIDTRLREIVTMALDNSRDLREAIASVKSANAAFKQERYDLFPTLDAQLSGTNSRSLTGTDNQTSISRSYSAQGVTTSFELDLFGKNQSLTREQYQTYLSTVEGARSTRLTVLYNTVNYWLTFAADSSNLMIAKETEENARQTLELTKQNFKHGIISELDVISAETSYRSAQANTASYLASVAQDKNALVLVVGQNVPDSLMPTSIDDVKNALSEMPVNVSSEILLTRPDVLAAEYNLKAANASIGAARANFFPTISLTASAGVGSSSLSSLFNNGAGIWSFAPSIDLPIFKGGYNVATLKYSEAQKESYVATYEKTIQTAFKEVADALATRGTIQQQLDANKQYVSSASKYFDLAHMRYRQGIDSWLTALDAQRTLYTAKLSLVSVEKDYYANLITLYKVMGGGTLVQAVDN